MRGGSHNCHLFIIVMWGVNVAYPIFLFGVL